MVLDEICGKAGKDTASAISDADYGDLHRLKFSGFDWVEGGVIVGKESLGDGSNVVDVY